MSQDNVIRAKDIPAPFNRGIEDTAKQESYLDIESFKEARALFEKTYIEKKLHEFNGNISQTAEAIGVERSNLHKKIKAYELDDFR